MSQETLNIDLNQFLFKGTYKLSSASVAQIMIGLGKTVERLEEPKNSYQEILYPYFSTQVPALTKSFKNLLNYGSEKERMTRFYNLGGKMTKGTKVKMKYHHNVNLGNGNFGPFIEAAIQRVEYILTRKTPLRYESDADFLSAFDKLKDDLKPFLEELKEAQKAYTEVVTKARNTVDMEKVKKNKIEKVKAHRQKKVIDKQSESETSETENQNNADVCAEKAQENVEKDLDMNADDSNTNNEDKEVVDNDQNVHTGPNAASTSV
jgi:hypothetical protein